LIATAVVEPQLDGTDLRSGVTSDEARRLGAVANRAARDGTILRLRLRDLDGRVVYSPDGSGLTDKPEDEAVDAGKGDPVGLLTRLNSDANDTGPAGQEVVEIYRAVYSHPQDKAFGVLEMYLPYEPIRKDVSSGTATLYRDLAVGLAALYIVLAGLSFTVTRRLRRQAQDNAYLAEHDQLTDLPNRLAFLARIEAMTTDQRHQMGAVAIIDLDRFKDVNDTLGHDNGDDLLRRIGSRLVDAVRPGDMVARLGGDEFGVVLARTTSPGQVESILHRLREIVAAPLEITDLPLNVDASIGYVLVPDDGNDGQTLLQRADIAMYVAKAGGSTVVRYDPAQDHFDADRLAVVGELHRALDQDELVLHFQPKLDLADGSVRAVEALVRWNHPRHGLLGPVTFIPVAEQTGLIDPLTDWILEHALRQVVAWDVQGGAATGLCVAVNVSARNLTHPAFGSRVLEIIDRVGTAPERLVLEITETALFVDVDRASGTLDQLRDAGIRISLDDFGQGQTSLGFLSRLPIHELKVDRQFVSTMCTDDANAAIVRSVVDLAHNLGMHVVAEGAEDPETVVALRLMGCDTVQGYTVARPMPSEALLTWAQQHRRVGVPT
jgi:diguanylate cyclase (GGDEF)-like protein